MNERQITALLEVTRVLAAESSSDAVLSAILTRAREIVAAERSTLFLVDGETRLLRSHLALEVNGQVITLSVGQGLAGHVAATGEIVNLADAYADPRFDRSVDQQLGYHTRTVLTVPMRERGGTITGVLQALNKETGGFTKEDEEVLVTLASAASIALENARHYEESRQRERVKRDLEIAHAIQMSLLPTKLPLTNAVEFAASCKPALAVGGDFYDFSEIENGRTLAVVGDVSGKGVSAGLIMGMVRTALRTEAYRAQSLAELFSYCNRVLFDDLAQINMFATGFTVAVDRGGTTLYYASAGHCQALLYRRRTGDVELLDTEGLPLGILPDATYEERRTTLESGDTVTLYSDGFTEAVGPGQPSARYGLNALVAAVRRHGHLPAEDLRQALVEEVTRFSAGIPQSDDQTIVIMKVR
ncbi:MAG: SpoIIE family protein phosphatase [Chloroflexi bacterium]|nr:SpoIIE family protein phosphatase [Chloroflexota bacterium]